MTILYEFTPTSLRKGMGFHLQHRHPITRFITPVFGIIFILAGLYHIFGGHLPNPFLGVVLVFLGVFYFILGKRRLSTAVKNAFKANPNDRFITLTATESALSFVDGETNGTIPFSAFVDFKICKTGLLLYPQKNIFHWIPDNAKIEDGTWQEFTDLVSSKITRKI